MIVTPAISQPLQDRNDAPRPSKQDGRPHRSFGCVALVASARILATSQVLPSIVFGKIRVRLVLFASCATRAPPGATVKVGAPEDVVSMDPEVRKCVVSGTVDKVMQVGQFAALFALPSDDAGYYDDHPQARGHAGGCVSGVRARRDSALGLRAGSARAPDPSVMGMYGTGMGGPQHAPAMGGSSRQIQPPLPPGTIPVQFQVPNESMGAVIGRGGSTINQIRQMSGAKVDIAQSVPGSESPRRGLASAERRVAVPMRLVTVTGTTDQIQMAQYLIQVKMGGGPLPTSQYPLASMS